MVEVITVLEVVSIIFSLVILLFSVKLYLHTKRAAALWLVYALILLVIYKAWSLLALEQSLAASWVVEVFFVLGLFCLFRSVKDVSERKR